MDALSKQMAAWPEAEKEMGRQGQQAPMLDANHWMVTSRLQL
jgi:hypothetical protein